MIVCAGKPSRLAAATASAASLLPSAAGDVPRFLRLQNLSVELAVRQHQEAPALRAQKLAFAGPGVRVLARRIGEPVSGKAEDLAHRRHRVVAGIVIAVEADEGLAWSLCCACRARGGLVCWPQAGSRRLPQARSFRASTRKLRSLPASTSVQAGLEHRSRNPFLNSE